MLSNGGVEMSKYKWMAKAVLGLFLLGNLAGCVKPLVKEDPPQYTGLGQYQDMNQGLGFTVSPGGTSKPNPDAPVIKNAFVIDRGIYGTTLKIYLEAEDPNGDMAKIATTVDQVGYGHYPTDFIFLKSQYGKHFRGYVQWNTFSSKAGFLDEWTRITVKVAVIDKMGRMSNEFEFPFTFETGVARAPNPPSPFDQGDLPRVGNVSIELYNPRFMGGGGGENFQ
jgi:hypothetical protein